MEDDKIASGEAPANETKPIEAAPETKTDEPAPAPKHYVLTVDPINFAVMFGVI